MANDRPKRLTTQTALKYARELEAEHKGRCTTFAELTKALAAAQTRLNALGLVSGMGGRLTTQTALEFMKDVETGNKLQLKKVAELGAVLATAQSQLKKLKKQIANVKPK